MDEQQTELENQQNKTENIETFDQSELNSENTVSAEPIMQKPIDTPEPVKKKKGDKYHYNSSPSWSSDTITAFDEAGTYYVRVCEYLGGHCGVYSNEITVTL